MSRMDDPVGRLVAEVWEERREKRLSRDAGALARRMCRAAVEHMDACEGYDPEADVRQQWLRGIYLSLQSRPKAYPRADGNSEATVMWLMDRVPEMASRGA